MQSTNVILNKRPSSKTPSEIADLILWLDANDKSTQDLTGGGGEEVTQWRDKSTSGNDFDEISSSVRPRARDASFGTEVVSGKRVIEFEAGGDILRAGSNITGTGPFTFFLVINKNVVGGGNDIVMETQKFRVLSRGGTSGYRGDNVILQTGNSVNDHVSGGTNAATIDTTFRLIRCEMEEVAAVDIYRLFVDSEERRPTRSGTGLLLDPQGLGSDRFVASGGSEAREDAWRDLGFKAGMVVTISGLSTANTSGVDVEVINEGANDSYNLASGDWTDDGWKVGMAMIVTGFVNSANNGEEVINAFDSATKLRTDNNFLTNEGPIGGTEFDHDNNSSTVGDYTIYFRSGTVINVDEEVLDGPDVVVDEGAVVLRAGDEIPQGTSGDSTGTSVGRDNSSSEGHDGHIAEIAVYDRVLTQSEVDSLEIYFNDKWGVTIA